ncbi:MAG TPA: universal stress protein [Acidimicrobiales bacterium]|nr:universal stress protein [Acidimicrobiales bacterium]
MFRSIVVGTDGSATAARAVEAAARLARENGARLHIVTAYSTAVPALAAASGVALPEHVLGPQVQQAVADQVASEARDTHCHGVPTEVHAVHRPAPDAIVEVAEMLDADLIVVGSKGMTGARRVLGSVPNSVAHSAPCAVLIVKTA